MGITALVMAGGKGSRLALSKEKPLLQIGGKPVIEHVLVALKNAKKVAYVVVAVSDSTPKTAELMSKFHVSVIKTPGKDYVYDFGYAVRALRLKTVLIIGADFPLITGGVIDNILDYYRQCGKPALSVVVSTEAKETLGLSYKYGFELSGRHVVPAGINVIDGRRIDEDELDEAFYMLDQKEVAVNINTLQELRVAEELFFEKVVKRVDTRRMPRNV
jgi:adenosylcobinamide-phosphate guanylyltransferase